MLGSLLCCDHGIPCKIKLIQQFSKKQAIHRFGILGIAMQVIYGLVQAPFVDHLSVFPILRVLSSIALLHEVCLTDPTTRRQFVFHSASRATRISPTRAGLGSLRHSDGLSSAVATSSFGRKVSQAAELGIPELTDEYRKIAAALIDLKMGKAGFSRAVSKVLVLMKSR